MIFHIVDIVECIQVTSFNDIQRVAGLLLLFIGCLTVLHAHGTLVS